MEFPVTIRQSLHKNLSGLGMRKGKCNLILPVGSNGQVHGDQIDIASIELVKGLINITAYPYVQPKVKIIGQLLQHLVLVSHGLTPIDEVAGRTKIGSNDQPAFLADLVEVRLMLLLSTVMERIMLSVCIVTSLKQTW